MKNSKKTRRALICSLLSLVVCVSMLVGSTYAWFTDTASAGVNTIQSGTLDVDLVNEAGESLEGETLAFKTADDRDTAILWEPGCTYELDPVYVKNNGNLALKYKIVVNGIDGDAKLLEAIEWTVNIGATLGADLSNFEGHLTPAAALSDAIVISGHMKEDAGNEYQNLTANGLGITVYATQDTVEYDSFNNTYDANAEYPAIVESTAQFSSALSDNSVEEVVLTNDIALSGANVMSGKTLDGNGNTITVSNTGSNCGIVAKSGVIQNVTVTGDGRGIGTGSSGSYAMDGDLTLNNVTIDGPVYAINIGNGNGHKLNANDSTILGWTSMAGVEATFTDCTFGKGTQGAAANYAVFAIYNTTTFNNCEFNDDYVFYGRSSSTGTITLNNCTHDGVAVTAANFSTLFDTPHDSDFDYLMNNCEIYVDGVRVTA